MGLTQAQLAEQMSTFYAPGYSQSTVHKTEAGSRPVRLNEAVAYAFLLREPLGLMLRPPGVANELTKHRAELEAKIRRMDEAALSLHAQRGALAREIQEISERLGELQREEWDLGEHREEA